MEDDIINKTERPRGFFFLLLLMILTWVGFGFYIINQAPPTDLSAITQKQDLLEKKLAEILSAAPANPEAVSNAAIEKINADIKQRELEAVSITAELATINNRTDGLEARIEELSKGIDKTGSRETSNNLMLSAIRLRDAVRESRNFESELMMVKAFAEGHPEVDTYIEILDKNSKGTPSISSLRDDFDPVAESIIKLSRIQKENPNLLDKAVLRFSKIVQVRKIDSTAIGNNPEDIIARTYNYLQKNELAEAVKEVNKLPEDTKILAKDWLEKAESNLAARDASEKIFLSSSRPGISN